MNASELDVVLKELGWSRLKLCRRLGLHRNTPSRWKGEVPKYVAEYLRVQLLAKESVDG